MSCEEIRNLTKDALIEQIEKSEKQIFELLIRTLNCREFLLNQYNCCAPYFTEEFSEQIYRILDYYSRRKTNVQKEKQNSAGN